MSRNFRSFVAASSLVALFTLSGCSNDAEPVSPNAGNSNVTSKTFNGSGRFVRFDDDKRAGSPDQMAFYRKDGGDWVPVVGVTEDDRDPETAEAAAQRFIDTNGFSWDSEGAVLTINAVPDALPQ